MSGSLCTRWPCCFFLKHSGPACHGSVHMVGAVGSGLLRAGGGEQVAGQWWMAAPQLFPKGVII